MTRKMSMYWWSLFHSPAKTNVSLSLELSWDWELTDITRAREFNTSTRAKNMAG